MKLLGYQDEEASLVAVRVAMAAGAKHCPVVDLQSDYYMEMNVVKLMVNCFVELARYLSFD